VDDRGEAEAEVGADLFVDVSRLDVELPDRELPFQVMGMTVRTEDGRVLGRVTNVLASSAQSVYEVTGESGRVLIPAVPAFIVARDSERGEMTVRPIPGLLDG
jgi:16S rRNA processing protein RimM